MGAQINACCRPSGNDNGELDNTKEIPMESNRGVTPAKQSFHQQFQEAVPNGPTTLEEEKKDNETDNWDMIDIVKRYLGHNSAKKIYSKLFQEEPSQVVSLLLENDSSPEIPGIYYKKQAPQYEGEFVDTFFPPEPESISYFDDKYQIKFGENEYLYKVPDSNNKKWLRPNEMSKKKTYFLYDTITTEDVHQGQLANVYFLNCLVSLAGKNLIEKIFDRPKTSENGCYALKTYIQGKQKIVSVDDAFPCLKSKFFAFSYAGPNELWVPVLEKVWAKMNRSYAMTLIGTPMDPFYAFCEAPCIEYNHLNYLIPEKEISELIFQAQNSGFLIFSAPVKTKEAEDLGLFPNQSYNILKIQTQDNITLLQLKNQWGGFEWKGDYSDSSPLWTEDLKKTFDMKLCEDGIFFISFKDYITYFPKTFILKYNDGWRYSFKKFHQTSQEKAVGMKLIVTEPTKVFVTLHTKPERFNSKLRNYHTVMSRIALAKPVEDEESISTKTYTYIGASSGKSEKLVIETDILEKGEYHVFVNSQWEHFPNHICPLVVSTYSEKTVSLEELHKEFIPQDFIYQIIKAGIESNIEENKYENIVRSDEELLFYFDNDRLKFGYASIYMKNVSDSVITIDNYTLNYGEGKLKIVSKLEYKEAMAFGSKEIEVKTYLNPGEEEIHIFELLDDVWNCNVKVKPASYSLNGNQTKETGIQKFFEENLQDNCLKEKLNAHLTYYEMETDDMIYLIIENNHHNAYRVKIELQDLCNLSVTQDSKIKLGDLVITENGFNYLKLKRIENNQPIGFSTKFKLRCLNE